MRAAFADPPYIGQARKHYAADPKCAEVNHALLAYRLTRYDAFALSCKSDVYEFARLVNIFRRALIWRGKDPEPLRKGPWVKPFCSFKPGVNPAYAHEEVLFYTPRKRTREQETVRDWVSANITLKTGLAGAKPPAFCYWLFEVLNLEPGDEFVDLFPGTGAVTQAWQRYSAHLGGVQLETPLFNQEGAA